MSRQIAHIHYRYSLHKQVANTPCLVSTVSLMSSNDVQTDSQTGDKEL